MQIPIWYTKEEIIEWLENEGWPDRDDLPGYLAYHFQEAFERGWKKALLFTNFNASQGSTDD